MRKLFPYLFLLILLALAAFSNPDQEMHQAALKDKLKDHLAEKMDAKGESEEGLTSWAQGLGNFLGGAVIEGVVEGLVRSEDYFFFSLTTLKHQGEDKVIGFGIFGRVFITKEIDKALQEGWFEEEES